MNVVVSNWPARPGRKGPPTKKAKRRRDTTRQWHEDYDNALRWADIRRRRARVRATREAKR